MMSVTVLIFLVFVQCLTLARFSRPCQRCFWLVAALKKLLLQY